MSPRESYRLTSPARPLRWAAALFALALLGAVQPAALARQAAEEAESDLGERLRARFEIDDLSDGLLLRPLAAGSAIRSIELADDGRVLVNGKEFDHAELEAFLGADGRLLVELVELGPAARRSRLGFDRREPSGDDGEDSSVSVDFGTPGAPRVRVRAAREDRVSVGRSIEIAVGETARDVVCIGCSIDVAGETHGEAVAVGGSVRVASTGRVGGEAVAVGGSVDVQSGGVVEGDAVAVGGTIHVEPGGEVLGQRSSVGIGGRLFGAWGDGWFPFDFATNFGGFFWSLFRAGFLALLVGLCLLVARPAVAAAGRRVTAEPWKAVFAGLLTQLLFLPVLVLVTVILAVSIIGIPLLVLVPVALVALVVGALAGFAAVAVSVGRAIESRFGASLSGIFLVAVLGVAAIQGLGILGRLVGIPGGVLGIVGFALIALGFCVKYVAWTLGLGAMTLVAFGRDWRRPAPVSEAPARPEPPGRGAETEGESIPLARTPDPPTARIRT